MIFTMLVPEKLNCNGTEVRLLEEVSARLLECWISFTANHVRGGWEVSVSDNDRFELEEFVKIASDPQVEVET